MERLAINGGPKAIPQEHGHSLKWPKIGQEEFSAIRDFPEAPQELMEQYIYAFGKVTAQADEVAKITIKNQDIKPPDKHSVIR